MFSNLKTIKDDDGTLVPIEFSDLPFKVKRIFYVCDVPKGEERGNHAHFETRQLLICLQGSILVKIHDGKDLKEYRLMPNQSVLVERMMWDSQVFGTGSDVLLCICSTSYNKSDYIEDFEEFLRIVNSATWG
jgi:hypothetical protein